MNLVKILFMLIIAVAVLAESLIILNASYENTYGSEEITATEYTQINMSIDALIQAIEDYNQQILFTSNHQFWINSQLQELYALYQQATELDEVAELEKENNRLQDELMIVTNQINIIRNRINETEIQLAFYMAKLDITAPIASYAATVLDTDSYAAIIEPNYNFSIEEDTETTTILSDTIIDRTSMGRSITNIDIEQQNNIFTLSIIVGLAGIIALIIIRILKTRKLRWIKTVATLMIIISVGGLGLTAVNSILDANATRNVTTPSTFILERTNMERGLSASGVVQSSETTNIFSMQSNPVLTIYVEVGDRVLEGDILARLDMSRLERDLEQAKLNLKNAEASAEEEVRINQNAITNAQTSLEAARIALDRQRLAVANLRDDLRQAEEDMYEPFDSSEHDRRIEDARLNVERRTADVFDAQQELFDVLNDFDDFVFVNAITEARVALDRAISALEEAEAELEDERNNAPDAFDPHVFQNNIDDAERALRLSREDRDAAQQRLEDAEWLLSMAWGEPDVSQEMINVQTAEAQLNNAERAVENAQIRLDRARDELRRARDDHYRLTSDGREGILSALEAAVERAQQFVEDRQRAYEIANEELHRSKDNVAEHAQNHLNRMRDNLSDAKREYERRLDDKERAMQDFIDRNTTRLENIQRQFSDTQTQLQTAQNNVRSAENSLVQARERPVTADTSVEIQRINIERLQSTLEEGIIRATTDGVITQVNTNVGAAPSGVLFVIEDLDNLYISSNVREHSLVDLYIGQRGHVTTLATGNREFDAEITFISPRAVSPAGSTSVEFEIRAAINGTDDDVRIGMNAFLTIVVDARHDVFSVPLSALVTNENGSFIYVYENDAWYELAITTGLRTSTHIEVFSDRLREGMNVLARPLDILGR